MSSRDGDAAAFGALDQALTHQIEKLDREIDGPDDRAAITPTPSATDIVELADGRVRIREKHFTVGPDPARPNAKMILGAIEREWIAAPVVSQSELEQIVDKVWSAAVKATVKDVDEQLARHHQAISATREEEFHRIVMQGMRDALALLPTPGNAADYGVSLEHYHKDLLQLQPRRCDDGSYELVAPEDSAFELTDHTTEGDGQ